MHDLTPVTPDAEQAGPEPILDQSTALLATRRTVLRSIGLSAVVGGSALGLAACAADETPAAPAASAADPTQPAPAPASEPATDGGDAGPSVATADVPVGGGVVMSGADYVVTQPTEGEFKAFTSKCTHMGCKVGKVESKEIVCPCHGSRFSIVDGSVTNGPATEPLQEFDVSMSGDQVTVTA